MKVGKLLIPLDGSPLAETALGPALDFAAGNPDATILLIRAAEATTLPGGDPIEDQVRVVREAEEYLEAVASRLTQRGATRVKTSVWYGPAAPAIVEAADASKPDLIVMSTHGRSGVGRLLLGSVAESVLRATHTPILMLRPDSAPVERPRGSTKEMGGPEMARSTGKGASKGPLDPRALDGPGGTPGPSRDPGRSSILARQGGLMR